MSDFTLYYTATSCGAANFIVASLGGTDFASEQVNIGPSKKTASGADFLAINPKGNVPAIALPNGYVLSENVSCLPFLADRNPDAGLAPPPSTAARYIFLDKLAFVNATLHKAHGPLFGGADDAAKAKAKAAVVKNANYYMDTVVGDGEYAMGGEKPTAVDIYAYITMTWSAVLGIPLKKGAPKAAAYMEKIAALPGVQAAQKKMAEAPKPA